MPSVLALRFFGTIFGLVLTVVPPLVEDLWGPKSRVKILPPEEGDVDPPHLVVCSLYNELMEDLPRVLDDDTLIDHFTTDTVTVSAMLANQSASRMSLGA